MEEFSLRNLFSLKPATEALKGLHTAYGSRANKKYVKSFDGHCHLSFLQVASRQEVR